MLQRYCFFFNFAKKKYDVLCQIVNIPYLCTIFLDYRLYEKYLSFCYSCDSIRMCYPIVGSSAIARVWIERTNAPSCPLYFSW